MAFTADEEARLLELLNLFPDIEEALRIAEDEAVRVRMNALYQADATDFSPGNRERCANARTLMRKMYRHHADGKRYPWRMEEIHALNRGQIEAYLADHPDPDPDSDAWRTKGT